MKHLLFLIACVLCGSVLYAQPPVRISWAGELNCEYCPLDSVVVTNKSNGEKVVFHYPDTVYVCSNVGIVPVKQEEETHLKVYPNPFSDKVQAEFSLLQSGEAVMTVYDMLGREVIHRNFVLEQGTHCFNLSLPNGIYTLHLQTTTNEQSVRLLSQSNKDVASQIVYSGIVSNTVNFAKKVQKSEDNIPFQYGDTLIMQGFISDSDAFQYRTEQVVPLTEDAHITFAFFNELAFVDTNEIIIIDSLKHRSNKPCYYNSFYQANVDSKYGNFIVINTQIGLDSLFACDNLLISPIVAFSRQSLVLVRGWTPDVLYNTPSFSFIKNCNEKYIIKMDILDSAATSSDEFYWMVIVNEVIQSKEQVKLIINIY